MRRIVSIWLPQWPIDRLRRAGEKRQTASLDDTKAFVLTDTIKNVQQLTAVNEAGRAGGLAPGMTLTHARALIPDLPNAPADPDADRHALDNLADWCGRYSPATGVDHSSTILDDHGLWIDVTGCAHLFGGEQALIDDLDRRLMQLGLLHRLGLAETMGAAWAIARFCLDTPIIRSEHLRQGLADMPVAGLRLAPDIVTLLRRLGLKRIGQLDALPRVSLAKRFPSKEAGEGVVRRLDQILGRQEEPLSPRRPLPVYRTAKGLLEPIAEVSALAHVVQHLASDLCRMLDRASQGAERLTLLAYRVDGDVARLNVGASQPTRDRCHIERLFAERLESIDAGFGIDRVALHADQVGPLRARQMSLTSDVVDTDSQDVRLAQLIDRLANRLGPEAVTVSVPFASYLPERAERHVSAMAAAKEKLCWADEGSPDTPRPSSLLPHPEPITAMAEVPDGPPLRFTWRRVTRRIVKAEGPERIALEWWASATCEVGAANGVDSLQRTDETCPTRDYYRVEDDQGRRYWLFRAGLYNDTERLGSPRWFVHGLFG